MNINTVVPYDPTQNIVTRFKYHVNLGLFREIGSRKACPKNWLEKIGDYGLWFVEDLPRKISLFIRDPRVATIAITALALLAASFVFYPITTIFYIKAAFHLLPEIPFWAVKFSAYVFVVETILASSCRAQGRFWNKALMEEFYQNRTPV